MVTDQQKEAAVTDIHFVLSECLRLQELIRSTEPRELVNIGPFGSLPSPNGRGEISCSHEALQATATLHDSDAAGTMSRSRIARAAVIRRPLSRSTQLICPARSARFVELDQADATCPVPLAKIFRFPSDPNHFTTSRHPGPHRGAFRDRHERRVGMRWTRAALLTRALFLRTAKSCGPDAPTLASSWR